MIELAAILFIITIMLIEQHRVISFRFLYRRDEFEQLNGS